MRSGNKCGAQVVLIDAHPRQRGLRSVVEQRLRRELVFRRFVSQPIEWVIERINPILQRQGFGA